MIKYLPVILCFLLIAFHTEVKAQLNFKIGYELDNFQSKQNEILTKKFNEENFTILEQGKNLPELHYMNGLTLGVSYKTAFSRTEISWHTVFRTREAFGETTDPVESFDVYKRYSIRGFQLMYELYYKRVGVGATVGRDIIRMKSDIVNSTNDKTITKQELYNTRFHMSLELTKNDRLSLILRPFFTLYLDEFDHQPIYNFLDITPDPGVSTRERPWSYGISLIFLNGLQRD